MKPSALVRNYIRSRQGGYSSGVGRYTFISVSTAEAMLLLVQLGLW